ncbi:MAG: dihydropteroate synthase, partial [Bacteroidota bacterium]
VMVGFSRKSMINKVLSVGPRQALNGTTALNTIALQKGANILRVHDARQAKESIQLSEMVKSVH